MRARETQASMPKCSVKHELGDITKTIQVFET